jgi:hypothetical protein
MANFTIERLSPERVSDAWPILQATRAEPLPQWWESEGKDLIQRGGGVLVARAADGSIHGLATYETAERPDAARVLAVETLVTFELSRKQPAKRALCAALELLATELGCSGVGLPILVRGCARYLETAKAGQAHVA